MSKPLPPNYHRATGLLQNCLRGLFLLVGRVAVFAEDAADEDADLCASFPGAAIFNWRLTTATAPTVIVQSAQTTAASNIFGNLTPGVVYNVQANAVGAAGPSDWSDPVSHMVM